MSHVHLSKYRLPPFHSTSPRWKSTVSPAGKMLFGNKRSRKVVVHNQPVGINSVGEEIAGIIVLCKRRDAERLIHRNPSHPLEIDSSAQSCRFTPPGCNINPLCHLAGIPLSRHKVINNNDTMPQSPCLLSITYSGILGTVEYSRALAQG